MRYTVEVNFGIQKYIFTFFSPFSNYLNDILIKAIMVSQPIL